MKNNFTFFSFTTILLTFLFSCADGSSYDKSERAYNESNASEESGLEMEIQPKAGFSNQIEKNSFFSSTAAAVSEDTTRKLIRTADLKFRVINVQNASIAIENIIQSFDGFVTSTDLVSKIDRKEITPISADSSLETIYYSVNNDIHFRVPVAHLDTALRTIAKHIDFLDYRKIQVNDVTFQLLLNKMAEGRLSKHTQRVESAIDHKNEKLKHTTNAEDQLLSREEMRDRTKIRTMEILDEIEYSSVKLKIYQRQDFKRTVIENNENIEAYKPGLWSDIKEALYSGWHILKSIFIALLSIWPLLILGIVGYFVYLKFFKP